MNLIELPRNPDYTIISWDTACEIGEKNDYSACTIWLVSELKQRMRQYFLIEAFKERLLFPDLEKKVIATADRYRNLYPDTPQKTLIENASSGRQLIQSLDRSNGRWFEGVSINGQDKVARFLSACSIFEKGNVLLPTSAHWLDEYRNELLRFPNGKFDDYVDSTSQALLWRQNRLFLDSGRRPNPIRPKGSTYKRR